MIRPSCHRMSAGCALNRGKPARLGTGRQNRACRQKSGACLRGRRAKQPLPDDVKHIAFVHHGDLFLTMMPTRPMATCCWQRLCNSILWVYPRGDGDGVHRIVVGRAPLQPAVFPQACPELGDHPCVHHRIVMSKRAMISHHNPQRRLLGKPFRWHIFDRLSEILIDEWLD